LVQAFLKKWWVESDLYINTTIMINTVDKLLKTVNVNN
jgi:hypothetical protein